MADIDKFLKGPEQADLIAYAKSIASEQMARTFDALLNEGFIESYVRSVIADTPGTPSNLEQAKYLLDVTKTLLVHSAADSPEETSALAYLKGIVDAALPPEEVHTGLDQRAGGEPTGGAESASRAGEGLQSEDQGATIPYEAPHDRGSDPQDRTPQGS